MNRETRNAINSAWFLVVQDADDRDHSGPRMLRDAFKIECKERGKWTAIALLVQCWLDGFDNNPTARELYHVSPGCAVATMCGARAGTLTKLTSDELATIRAGYEAWKNHLKERVA